jgi:hypothetical protein
MTGVMNFLSRYLRGWVSGFLLEQQLCPLLKTVYTAQLCKIHGRTSSRRTPLSATSVPETTWPIACARNAVWLSVQVC